VIFELFSDAVPKTSEKFVPPLHPLFFFSLYSLVLSSFRALCTGEKGLSPLSDRPLYYKNSIIHRSITDFMIQGGGKHFRRQWFYARERSEFSTDFTKRNGTGGESIYGGPFADEDLTHPIDSEGSVLRCIHITRRHFFILKMAAMPNCQSHRLLCMANRGPNTNGSQFFITLRACPHLNGTCYAFPLPLSYHNRTRLTRARTTPGKHVVFGKVIRGFDDVVRKIAQVSTDEKDRPAIPVIVFNCGELELRKKAAPPR
jgi:cyclophilin family peptidyl-prolyl cis-trans isomerase